MINVKFTENELRALRAIAGAGFKSMWEEVRALVLEDPESPVTKAAQEFACHAGSGLALVGVNLDPEAEEKELFAMFELGAKDARDVPELLEIISQDPRFKEEESNAAE